MAEITTIHKLQFVDYLPAAGEKKRKMMRLKGIDTNNVQVTAWCSPGAIEPILTWLTETTEKMDPLYRQQGRRSWSARNCPPISVEWLKVTPLESGGGDGQNVAPGRTQAQERVSAVTLLRALENLMADVATIHRNTYGDTLNPEQIGIDTRTLLGMVERHGLWDQVAGTTDTEDEPGPPENDDDLPF